MGVALAGLGLGRVPPVALGEWDGLVRLD